MKNSTSSGANLSGYMNPPKSLHERCRRSIRAFTLIEVLAVLGILGLLACVLSPALARTKPGNNAAQCLANMRHLMGAWTMYADDSRGILPPNCDGGNAGKVPGDASWVGGWLDYTTSTDNTNVALLVNHTQWPYGAYLGPYLVTASAFKCPSDRSIVTFAGQKIPRPRSVSMNSRVGTMTRYWTGQAYRLYPTLSSMVAPKPSELFVLNDEREDSINEGCFMVDPDSPWLLVDFPGAYHGNAGSFGFADGHVELQRWRDLRTVPPLAPGQLLPLNIMLPGDVDAEWIQQHCSAPKQ